VIWGQVCTCPLIKKRGVKFMSLEKHFNCMVYSLEGLAGSIPVTDRTGKVRKIRLGEKEILSESNINNLRNCVYTDYAAQMDEKTNQLRSVPVRAKRFLIEVLSEVQLEPKIEDIKEAIEAAEEKRGVGRPRKEI
jgi:hypothetical protein